MLLDTCRLENSYLKVDVSTFGGKITSMYSKRKKSEWLFQSEDEEVHPASDGSFTKDVAFGCDEMFPTINPESSLQSDGSIVPLPDHGELWSNNWEILSQNDDSIDMRYDGKLLPYRFVRNVLILNSSIICRYTVLNLSDSDIPALWTPHPLFSFYPETEIFIPQECHSITQAGNSGELGEYLNTIEWGDQGFIDGVGKLLIPDSLREGSAYKFYCSQTLSEGQVIIQDNRGKMTMSYPSSVLPWLGFWINNGGYSGQKNFAPEPATAPFDSPAKSEDFGVKAIWKAGEIREWELIYSFE